MSFELRPGESLRKGIRRITRSQLNVAMEQLGEQHKQVRNEAVHAARKAFKKLRAVLRLVRPAIGESIYRAENACFRDAGRPLTEVRDAKIVIETLDKLAEHYQEQVANQTFSDIRKQLQTRLRAVRKRVLDEEEACALVKAAARQARARIKDWADVRNKWRTIGLGLEDVYRRAKDAFDDACSDPSIEKLHEWRKQTKYLRYQLQILRPLWSERIEELIDESDRLAELLGDDHDLAVLQQMLTTELSRFDNESDTEILFALIDRRRTELEQESILLGRRFFQEQPVEFARRMKGYWKTWISASSEPQDANEAPPQTMSRNALASGLKRKQDASRMGSSRRKSYSRTSGSTWN